MCFEDPPLDTMVNRSLGLFLSLALAYEGQGKEMSFCKDQKTASSTESVDDRLAAAPKLYDIVELAGHGTF